MADLLAFPNFRPLGGQRTVSGRRVRDGLVFRSEALLDPQPADAAAIAARNIAVVCDLRSDAERAHAPNGWWAARGIERLELDLLGAISARESAWPLLKADPTAAGALATMRGIYAALPRAAAPQLAMLFRRIGQGGLPMLIHCTAGKDRTGFVSALLLAALGVPRDAILADYLASRGRGTERVREATRAMIAANAGTALSLEALEALMGVEEAYLDASFAVVEHEFGGVEAYLAATGLSVAELDEVRGRLLE